MTNKFKEVQIKAEILNELYELVESNERRYLADYTPVGEKQSVDWRTGELMWEDEEKTIPKMEKVWDYVEKDDEEITPEDRLRIKIYQQIKTQLEKMI